MSEVIYRIDGIEYREQDGISLLVEAAARICGSQVALARRLHVSRSAVAQWAAMKLQPSEYRISQMRGIVEEANVPT